MDFDDEVASGRPRSQAGMRESSLTKGYEALGATQFHSMDAGEDLWRMPALPLAPVKPSTSMGARSLSSSGLLRGASNGLSAMEMDLGSSPMGGLKELNLPPSRPVSRSSSTGALKLTKSAPQGLVEFSRKGGGMLPAIPGTPSSGSVAWSMQMSRPRRDTLAAVF